MKTTPGMVMEGVFWGVLLFVAYLLMEDVKLHEPWTTKERFVFSLAAGLVLFGVWVS